MHDAVQLDLAGLVRRDMTRGHVHRSARGDAAGTHIERGRIRRDRAHAQGEDQDQSCGEPDQGSPAEPRPGRGDRRGRHRRRNGDCWSRRRQHYGRRTKFRRGSLPGRRLRNRHGRSDRRGHHDHCSAGHRNHKGRLERVDEGSGGLPPGGGILREAAHDDRVHILSQVGVARAWGHGLAVDLRVQQLHERLAVERDDAGEHLVCDRGQRVAVRRGSDLATRDLLGRHVGGGAGRHAGHRLQR